MPAKEEPKRLSKIVERRDFTPTGFRWLGLSRITVRRLIHCGLSPPTSRVLLDPRLTAVLRFAVGGARRKVSAPIHLDLMLLNISRCSTWMVFRLCCLSTCRACRRRFWEAARRTSRKGDVDGVAIIAKVLKDVRSLNPPACYTQRTHECA